MGYSKQVEGARREGERCGAGHNPGSLLEDRFRANIFEEKQRTKPQTFLKATLRELRNIYHHHSESQKRKSSEGNSAPSAPTLDMENQELP